MENNNNNNNNQDPNVNNIDEGQGGDKGGALEFTDEQLAQIQKMIQSESDRRTNQALAKQKREYEKKLSLAGLDEEARAKAEKDAELEELRAQVAQFQIERNRSELKSVLSTRGLSAEFADILTIGEDISEAQANIDKLDKLFKAAVTAEVEKRLAKGGNNPRGNNGGNNGEITAESIKKMNMAELSRLEIEQPEVFKKFFG